MQWVVMYWVVVCFFAAGARSKGFAFTLRTWVEIAQAAGIAVLVFALLTEGRGCTRWDTSGTDLGSALLLVVPV